MLSPLSFLADELHQNGIAAEIPELMQHSAVLAELSYALSPTLHEGKLQPYGFIVLEKNNVAAIKNTCQKLSISLSEARRVADGCHGFSIFKSGVFHGVFIPQYAAYTELQLLQLQQELNAIICITDANGITKLFCDAGLFIHQYRSWQKKPCISRALKNICRCAPQANFEILKDLLEFCFHDLSSRKIGATLVWCLAEPDEEEWENMRPNFMLKDIETKVGSDRSVAVLRHLLTYTDGAAILDEQARAIGVGAQLKYSEASKRLIEAHAGTRHTSAQRFSYDFPKGIIFVVSSDGPVTVFSDGMNVTDLEVRFANEPSPETSEDQLPPESLLLCCSRDVTCQGCKKQLKIQEIDSDQIKRQDKVLHCPVCSHFLHSVTCSNLDVHVVKALWRSRDLTRLG
ncbi:MAG TPA: DNA integrity scanning protein DisA nucleotide-binding domain protein [Leptolyngbyaceae cyanobacterium M33_DOE_097]|uniref:DAC domain-containing protein n=1 Tax=Oscillatoriales cyanobacterium SpSt-418 TaxID=2282169 RepID=A0A7C3KK89_9CYAN|nr:DNA integrity scanning protein DisA nucleotide-binding domain protein [Leptolyngbyaceae cyanobacterium M33_DOE_097]